MTRPDAVGAAVEGPREPLLVLVEASAEHASPDEWVREKAADVANRDALELGKYQGVWRTVSGGVVHLFASDRQASDSGRAGLTRWTKPDWAGYEGCGCGASAGEPCTVGLDPCVERTYHALGSPDRPDTGGPMLKAVRQDLGKLGESAAPGHNTYAAMALWLAGVIDKRGGDEGPSVTAKLAAELRTTMVALTRKGGDGDDDGFSGYQSDLGTPVDG